MSGITVERLTSDFGNKGKWRFISGEQGNSNPSGRASILHVLHNMEKGRLCRMRTAKFQIMRIRAVQSEPSPLRRHIL